MSKFKVGDKVRVVANENGHEFSIGEVVTIKSANHYDYAATNGTDVWYLMDEEIEPAIADPKIEVGGTYITRKQGKRICIAVSDTHAWLTIGNSHTAYVWTIDGKANLGPEWDIVFLPTIEVKYEAVNVAGEPMTIRYEVIDGVADLKNATIAPF